MLLIGAGGGVGSAAAQIARRLGARVIGADKRAPLPHAPIRAIAETLIVGAEDLPAEVRAATGDKGADVVFDLVGGVMFRSALKCLALRGRLIEIAATGQRDVSFDLADFYHNESRLSAWTRSSAILRRRHRSWMSSLRNSSPAIIAPRPLKRPAGLATRRRPIARSRRERLAALCCGRRNKGVRCDRRARKAGWV